MKSMVRTLAHCLIDLLGEAEALHESVQSDPIDLRSLIKAGLPYRSLESLRLRLRLSLAETANILHIPMRTLARRKREKKLQALESDRLVRLARIAAHAVLVFGSEQSVATWLRRPNHALGGEAPFRLLDTEVGTAQVQEVLSRIEFGVVA